MSNIVKNTVGTHRIQENCVYVGNLPWSLTIEKLKSIMEKVGDVCHCCIWLNSEGKSMGSGVVEFTNKASVEKAKQTLKGLVIENRKIYITDYSKHKNKNK